MTNIPISAFTVPVNTTGIGLSGFSLTGSNVSSVLDLTGTWNTSGTPSAIKLDITDTASNSSSLLMDLKIGGTTKFRVEKTGVSFGPQFITTTQVLLDAPTISFDANISAVAEVTLTATGRTFTPSNLKAGGTYLLFVKQDGTGDRTITTWTNFRWPNGIAPVLSRTANSTDIISGVSDGTYIYATSQIGFA